jgi:serine protease inhibitor
MKMGTSDNAPQTGHFPAISVSADTVGEAFHSALIEVHEHGCRAETPYYN